MAAKNRPNELHLTRVYDAPVKMVWEAWTDPKKVAQWWGPRGFTITTKSKDVRSGGSWTYTMHGPDGVDYPNITKFLEVDKYARLVYDHGGNEDTPPMFRVTVLFKEVGGKTRMDMTMAHTTVEAANESRKIVKKHSGNSTWDRLAEFLSQETTGKDVFVINRTFDAPINLTFEMFTDPKHFSQWLPPTGFKMNFIRPDIKLGGTSFYSMTGSMGGPGGGGETMTMYGKATYQEISKPNRIVYTQYFCDENENVTRHPMSPTWPEAMMTTISLEAESDDTTRVTVRWEIAGQATEAEKETFHKSKAGMNQGWGGSFEKLENYLVKVRN